MSTTIIATFVAACILLAVTPGPNMSLIIASTLSGGLRAGLMTLAGTMTGLTILVTIATAGMTSVMVFMSDWFDIIRWFGAVYLIWLGCRQFYGYFRADPWRVGERPQSPAKSRYVQGLFVALSNPKVLLFLGAFLPQFVDPQAPPGSQLVVLGVIFVLVLAMVDLGYTVAIAKVRAQVDMQRLRLLDGLAGALLVVGGLVLATARRP